MMQLRWQKAQPINLCQLLSQDHENDTFESGGNTFRGNYMEVHSSLHCSLVLFGSFSPKLHV